MAKSLAPTIISTLLLLAFAEPAIGGVLFSTLPRTLVVSASPKANQVLMAGEDNITVTWRLNGTVDSGEYKKAKARLCYAPVSQEDRAWRKTKDDLSKDKTCQFAVATLPIDAGKAVYFVGKDIPSASYFVRVYALDGDGKEVAYGQTTDAKKTANIFEVKGVSGRHASIDAAAACFSAASLLALAGFFVAERRKGNK